MKTLQLNDFRPGLTPCGHRLLVYPLPTERKTDSGLIIPDILADREDMAQVEALVIAVGPGCWDDRRCKSWCAVGDTILIGKYSGLYRIGRDKKAYRFISDLDVVGIVHPEEF